MADRKRSCEVYSPCHREPCLEDVPAEGEPAGVYCPSCGRAWRPDDHRLIDPPGRGVRSAGAWLDRRRRASQVGVPDEDVDLDGDSRTR